MALLMKSTPGLKYLIKFSYGMSSTLMTMYLNSYTYLREETISYPWEERLEAGGNLQNVSDALYR